MNQDYIPGDRCECSARCSCECGCDVDWTPREVYELREQRDRMQHEREFFQSAFIEQGDVLCKVIEQRDRLAEALRKLVLWADCASRYMGNSHDVCWEAKEALAAVEGVSDDN